MTTPHPCKFVAVVIGFLLSFVVALAAPMKFEIPAQPAPAALKAFIKQSSQQVVFNPAELDGVNANEVIGSFEPAAALDILLKGTGFNATKGKGGIFTVKKSDASATTGSVRGSLTGEGGKGVPNVLVSIRETAQSSETDRYGVYTFPNVAAGTYVLVASATGYQTMHIEGVNVKAGRELTLGKEEMRKVPEGVLHLEAFVVHADTVEQLEKFEVTGTKQKPFEGANVDIPRTIDDPQAYYIFDSKTIDQSGATNVEDFLKRRLTQNTTAVSSGQIVPTGSDAQQSPGSTTSSINLLGLGASQTLILVNGRRAAGVTSSGPNTAAGQPDLNGIPLAAIDRIEVLPSSASAIYGAQAVGGVINIILKKDFKGGEIRYTYENTTDTDAPITNLDATYGFSLEGGKTHVMINAHYSSQRPLLYQDRLSTAVRGEAIILARNPSLLYSLPTPFRGAATNIGSSRLLVLRDGTPLNSQITFVPAGTSPTTSPSTLASGLLANAGKFNSNPDPGNSQPGGTQGLGLGTQLGWIPHTKSLMATVSRDMTSWMQAFVEASVESNSGKNESSTGLPRLFIPTGSPINPFQRSVFVTFPVSFSAPTITDSVTRTLTTGLTAKLPFGWRGEMDYTWSENSFKLSNYSNLDNVVGSNGPTDPLVTGALNPFVDTVAYPQNVVPYLDRATYSGSSTLNDFALRASGPLLSFPWGAPTFTIGLEHRREGSPTSTVFNMVGSSAGMATSFNSQTLFFGRAQVVNSIYGELGVPLVTARNSFPLVHSFELQLAGREEFYRVDAGTPGATVTTANFPFGGAGTTYLSPTNNGAPYRVTTKYSSAHPTVGFKYKPIKDITIRASFSTAFVPPTFSQLLPNFVPDTFQSFITDPKKGTSYAVNTQGGGNPNLLPQRSRDFNMGMIWEPHNGMLDGLRVAIDFYALTEFNQISTQKAQFFLTNESVYPSRVTRDASTGLVTLVNTSTINLFKWKTEGWTPSIEYRKATPIGTFDLYVAATIVEHFKEQVSATTPFLEYVGLPPEGGVAKIKANGTLTWKNGPWTLGWSTTRYGGYMVSGAAGDDVFYNGAKTFTLDTTFTDVQGSDTIPSQTYHDVFAAYSFGNATSGKTTGIRHDALSGLTVQVGIKNLFNIVPPFDVDYPPFYYSPYGDIRLRAYWISIRKAF